MNKKEFLTALGATGFSAQHGRHCGQGRRTHGPGVDDDPIATNRWGTWFTHRSCGVEAHPLKERRCATTFPWNSAWDGGKGARAQRPPNRHVNFIRHADWAAGPSASMWGRFQCRTGSAGTIGRTINSARAVAPQASEGSDREPRRIPATDGAARFS